MKLLLENWREYLDEVERFPDIATSQDKIQQSLDYFYQEHAPKIGKREDLGDWMGHKMVKFALPNREAFFFAVDGDDRAKAYCSGDRNLLQFCHPLLIQIHPSNRTRLLGLSQK